MKHSAKQYTCIIIDDDFSSINILSEYIALIPMLRLVKSYLNPASAISALRRVQQIDFLFLDINMSISGIDIAKAVRDRARFIIMVTGYPEYALKAFDGHADRFMARPVPFEKFLITVNQVLKMEFR